jgi:hypothetical protein
MRLYMAMRKLATECEADQVVPNMWLEYLEAVTPDTGFHVRWYALWMDVPPTAPPLQLLTEHPQLPRGALAELLNTRLNRTQVRPAELLMPLLGRRCLAAEPHAPARGSSGAGILSLAPSPPPRRAAPLRRCCRRRCSTC